MVWNMNKHIFFVKGQTANILCFVGHKISVTTAHPPLTWAVTGNTGTDQGGHGAGGKEPACQHRRHRRHRFHPWVRKIPWRRRWQPTPVFFPGDSHGQRRLVGYSPYGPKESDTNIMYFPKTFKISISRCTSYKSFSYLGWDGSSSKVVRETYDIEESLLYV